MIQNARDSALTLIDKRDQRAALLMIVRLQLSAGIQDVQVLLATKIHNAKVLTVERKFVCLIPNVMTL